jgi:antitoxin HigA-1
MQVTSLHCPTYHGMILCGLQGAAMTWGFKRSLNEDDMAKKLPPVHPGEILREDFLAAMKLTPYAVAKALGVPRTRIERLAREETPVTADTALRLARYFGTTPAFWMGIQAQYDLERASDHLAKELLRIEPMRAA